jgi:hypothetical protein
VTWPKRLATVADRLLRPNQAVRNAQEAAATGEERVIRREQIDRDVDTLTAEQRKR